MATLSLVVLLSSLFISAVQPVEAAIASPANGWYGRGDSQGRIATPSIYQRPRFRWWWPGGWVDSTEVANEITTIIDGGFGGGEISDIQDSVKVDLDPQVYGWGQARWNDAVLAAYQTGNKLGGHVDMTLGPHWPTGFPGYTPDSPETSKELVHGQIFIQAGQTFSSKLPLPIAAPSGNETGNPNVTATPFLIAVIVARTSTINENASIIEFDPSMVQILTSLVKNNNTITWTAPKDGTYVLVAAYARGTGQIQNMYDGNPTGPKLTYPWPAYIVDHFSSAGVQAGVDYWNKHLLTPQLRTLLPGSQGSIFEDSLELKYKQYWTLNFLAEFKRRRKYDLTPFLFYIIQDTNTFSGNDTVAKQITNDFYQTVSDLYIDYRLSGVKQWANSIGLKLRLQPYTISADSCYAASVLDIPEGESLGFEGDNDAFRVLATGRDIGGKTTILSDELGAYMGEAYGVTWKFIIGTANLDMALGVSQVVIHGHPYRDSPSSLWPGFAPFTPLGSSSNGFADAWGPRQPQWIFANNASSYLANAQKMLQDSGPSVDVAILNSAWGVTASWDDETLNAAGYSYQFPTSNLLSKYGVSVKNGRLAPDGPSYKALVVDQTAMDVNTAQMLLNYGKAGLPIVLCSIPTTTFSYSQNLASDIAQLNSVFAQIQSLKTTKVISSSSAVPSALAALGVKPLVQYPESTNTSLITYRRTISTGYLYWIYNNGSDTSSETLSLEGNGASYLIDLWTGDVNAVPVYTSSNGYVSVSISLKATSVAAIYVGPSNPFSAPKLLDHITSTDCNIAYVSNTTIHLQSNNSCTATSSSGKTTTLNPSILPSPVTPASWTLTVQDWAPATTNETGLNSSLTSKTWLTPITLSELVAWPNISALQYVSGIGVYNTSITLQNKSDDVHVLLDLGDVEGTYGISINGKLVPGIDQWGNAPIDVTNYVVDGTNELTITVATTLWNQLIKAWPAIYGSETPQAYGVTGPVVFSYVKDVAI